MQDVKQADKDVMLFALVAIASSMVFAAVLWVVPSPLPGHSLKDSMFIVPALSCMVAALGVGWRRKVLYLTMTLGGFVLLYLLGARLGLLALASGAGGYLVDGPHTVATLVYQTFVVSYSLVMLIFFVGPRPAVLWTRPAKQEA